MRRFSIADIMIVIPAVALGTFILKAYLPGHVRMLRLAYGRSELSGLYAWVQWPVTCLVVPMMAALIAMRLRRPRPRRGRLVDQPGLVACLAVMASLVPGIIWAATIHHRPGFQRAEGFQQLWVITLRWAGPAVVGSWLALAISRRWRPERSWIDRAGRVLGLFWILLVFGGLAIPLVEKIRLLLVQKGLL